MTHRFRFILGMALAMVVFALPAAAQGQQAFVRVTNNVSDTGSAGLSVVVNQQNVVYRLLLGAQSDYVAIDTGATLIGVYYSEQDTPRPLGTLNTTFAPGQAYTIRLSGTEANPRIEVVEDGPVATLPGTGATSTMVPALLLLGGGVLAGGVLVRRRVLVH